MDFNQRIVTQIPLAEVWNETEVVSRERLAYLTSEDVAQLIKQDSVQFIVADVGLPLKWISIKNNFDFFKTKLKNKTADEETNRLEDFSDESFFFASKWKSDYPTTLILLEACH